MRTKSVYKMRTLLLVFLATATCAATAVYRYKPYLQADSHGGTTPVRTSNAHFNLVVQYSCSFGDLWPILVPYSRMAQ